MSLIQMSVSGVIMILAVLIIRALFLQKLPKRTFPVMWCAVLARLLIPYSLPSAFSVYSLRSLFARNAAKPQAPNAVPPPISGLPPQNAADAPSYSLSLDSVLTIVWAVGVLALAAFFTVSYIRCARRFRESLPVESEFIEEWLSRHRLRRKISVRSYDRITSPLTYGIFKPVILLPKTANTAEPADMDYVLFHEYVHIRRFDLGLKLLLTAALCVHWFDPMVWIMFIIANRDIEISCDEAVLLHFGEEKRRDYAMALIRMEEKKSGITPLSTQFGKRPIEERIVTVMKFKKATTISIAAAVFLTLGTTAAFATTAKQPDEPAERISSPVEPTDSIPSDSVSSDSTTSELDTPVSPDTSSDSSENSDNSAEEPSSGSDTSSLPAEPDEFTNDPRIPTGEPYQVEYHNGRKIVYVGWEEGDTEHKDGPYASMYEDAVFVYRQNPNPAPVSAEPRDYANSYCDGKVTMYW